MAERLHEDMPTGSRFAQAIAELNADEGWGLDEAQRSRYGGALARLHPQGCREPILRRVIVAYHLDHELVEALRDPGHGDHLRAWAAWRPRVVAVLRHAGLAWSRDGAADREDLAQVACLELARSLAAYRYESRFASWAFQVIVRSARNELRGQRAMKRAGETAYLAGSEADKLPLTDPDRPESIAAARLLADLVHSVLAGQRDRRLAAIFRLWAVEDRRVSEIGASYGLSPARVRALLGQIVELLRQDVQIRAWLGDEALVDRDR